MAEMKLCPYCGESIDAEAVFCTHCRADLNFGAEPVAYTPAPGDPVVEKCPYCTTDLPSTATVCAACGAHKDRVGWHRPGMDSIPWPAPTAAAPTSTSKRNQILVVAALVVLVVAFLAVVLVSRDDAPLYVAPTTTAPTETVAQFNARLSPKMTVLSDAMGSAGSAAQVGDWARLKSSSVAMAAAAKEARAVLPSPDAELTRLLGLAFDEMITGAELELAAVDKFDIDKSAQAQVHLTSAKDLMNRATERLTAIS